MSTQQFEELHTQINTLGHQLQQYLHEYRQGQRSEGSDGDGLENLLQDIDVVFQALQKKRYEVAVVAAMKTGKSTLINALMGADVLASESAACTICRTDVRHIKAHETAQLLEYRDGQPVKIVAEGSASEIRQCFLKHTREIRNEMEQNPDLELPDRFELRYPIEAIGQLPSLEGFTLIDTPGPNEWSAGELTPAKVALKRTALEALRSCNAVLFILNYRSFKDNAMTELFQSITQNRDELLKASRSRIYFILNQVDLRSEVDPPLEQILQSLSHELTRFGFQDPQIYPASSLQGLLAKLICQQTASPQQIADFKKFFSARYAQENDEGDLIIPRPERIAEQALADSGILTIQEEIFKAVIHASGWNLLEDALNKLSKVATAIDDSINTQIAGWKIALETLQKKLQDYKRRAKKARYQLREVKEGVETQKALLINTFSQGVDRFADTAIYKIEDEIRMIADERHLTSPNSGNMMFQQIYSVGKKSHTSSHVGKVTKAILDTIPLGGFANVLLKIGGHCADAVFSSRGKLRQTIHPAMPETFDNYGSTATQDPYILRFPSQTSAENFMRRINQFCGPHIQNYWVEVQNELIQEGTNIREQIAQRIQEKVQHISDNLSEFLGDALEIRLSVNPIQFPGFGFEGIDNQIRSFQETHTTYKTEERRKKRKCNSSKAYQVTVPVHETRTVYHIDLRDVIRQMERTIKIQATSSKSLLKTLVEQQVTSDFKNAETQLEEYIARFEKQLTNVLSERRQRESEAPQIIEWLTTEHNKLTVLLSNLHDCKQKLGV